MTTKWTLSPTVRCFPSSLSLSLSLSLFITLSLCLSTKSKPDPSVRSWSRSNGRPRSELLIRVSITEKKMYKNQLQELAQRSCFNLPSYTCTREGPDHAPRFKAAVNFNGETFESPAFCTTLRQAEHSAAEVALSALAGGSHSLAARILDETGVYKNLLQEVSQRVGASLPIYKTFRSGRGHHLPAFTCIVELAGIRFTGEPAKNKKQAEKNAAMAAWFSLKQLVQKSESSSSEKMHGDEQEHVTVARSLQNFLRKKEISSSKPSLPFKFPNQNPRAISPQPPPARCSKILPLLYSKNTHNRPLTSSMNNTPMGSRPISHASDDQSLSPRILPQNIFAAGAPPYIPMSYFRPHHAIAPPVTIRNAIPCFSAPPIPPPIRRPPPGSIAPPVCLRQTIPVFAAPPVRVEEKCVAMPPANASAQMEERERREVEEDDKVLDDLLNSVVMRELLDLKI